MIIQFKWSSLFKAAVAVCICRTGSAASLSSSTSAASSTGTTRRGMSTTPKEVKEPGALSPWFEAVAAAVITYIHSFITSFG